MTQVPSKTDSGSRRCLVTPDFTVTLGEALSSGTSYTVTVQSQPAGQSCSVANGSGTMGAAGVSNVMVYCGPATFTVSTLVGSGMPGSADGPGTAASFSGPTGVAVDSSGNVYVADQHPQDSQDHAGLTAPAPTCPSSRLGTVGQPLYETWGRFERLPPPSTSVEAGEGAWHVDVPRVPRVGLTTHARHEGDGLS